MSGMRVTSVREAYLLAAEAAQGVVESPDVAVSWDRPSCLPGMNVGELAGHLARSVLQVEWFLDAPIAGGPVTDAVEYYARLIGTDDPESSLNVGVRARSAETAAQGHAAVSRDVAEVLARLATRLVDEPGDRRVGIRHRPGDEMLLDEYLRTRCVELVVHTDDIAISVGRPSTDGSPAATAIAVDLLTAAARRRHGDHAVLTALTRRERDASDAGRVL